MTDSDPQVTRYRIASFDEIILEAAKASRVAIDTEWDPYTETHDDDFHVHGMSLAVRNGETILAGYFKDHSEIQALISVIADGKKEVVAHYAQAEHISLTASEFEFKNDLIFRDTAVAINMLQEERPENRVGLKKLSPEFLNWELTEFSSEDMESEEFNKYAMEDAVATLMLYELFVKALVKYQLMDVYETICGSIQPFGDMSLSGMVYDLDVAEEQYEKVQTLRSGIENEIYKKIGRINLASPKQVCQRLFDELGYSQEGLDPSKKTGKIGTGVKNMAKLAERYPVCELILGHRTANKMITSMLEPWVSGVTMNSDSRLHPRYSLISKTGRTRSSKPNCQNIPKTLGKGIKFNKSLKAYLGDLKMRQGFVAPEGYKYVICDYSSAEYRLAAIAAQEPKLEALYCGWTCDACQSVGYDHDVIKICPRCSGKVSQGGDLHQRNCDIANAAGAEITRSQAKAVSFLAIFGGGAFKLSKDLNLPYDVCIQILNDVLDEFPGIRAWHNDTSRIIDTTGEVRDIFGRRRKINIKQLYKKEPDVERHKGIRRHAVNQLVNFVCQAPVSTICQIALQNTRSMFKKQGLWGVEIQPAAFVHDSIALYVIDDLAEMVLQETLLQMESAVSIAIPMATEGGIWHTFNED